MMAMCPVCEGLVSAQPAPRDPIYGPRLRLNEHEKPGRARFDGTGDLPVWFRCSGSGRKV